MSRSTTDSKDQERIKASLKAFIKEEGNRTCAECGAKHPSWASANLGCFFCLRCAGIHRSLGVHISFVKSATLDTWLAKEATKVIAIGNIKCNAKYEATCPASRKPHEDTPTREIERFIRDKYERCLWVKADRKKSKVRSVRVCPAFVCVCVCVPAASSRQLEGWLCAVGWVHDGAGVGEMLFDV